MTGRRAATSGVWRHVCLEKFQIKEYISRISVIFGGHFQGVFVRQITPTIPSRVSQ